MIWRLDAVEQSKKGSGRTTRMLQYAFKIVKEGYHVNILGKDRAHVEILYSMFEELLSPEERAGWREEWKLRLYFIPFGDVSGRYDLPFGPKARYNYELNSFSAAAPGVIQLIDHAVLQQRLRHIQHYLESTRQIEDHVLWLGHTAKAMTSLGRKVYVITDDRATENALDNIFADYPHQISIEDGTMMGNMNWLELKLERAHPNCQLLFDPQMLERKFAGALNEIKRWDNE